MEHFQQRQVREEQAIILDYLEHGYAFETGSMKTSIAQALGTTHLTLLELVPKKGVHLQPYAEVYPLKPNVHPADDLPM